MNDSRHRAAARRIAAVVCFLALFPAAAWAQSIPEEYTNLKVLPEGIQRRELVPIMRGFALGLGVRCSFCHEVSDGLDQPDDDFASDEKATKLKARVMLKMVQAINGEHLTSLEDRTEPNIEVTCATCHAGRSRPTTLVEELTWAAEDGGAEALKARYAELREEYYGRGTLDFGEGSLAAVARSLGRSNPEVGNAAVALNLEYYPESVQTWVLKGQLHMAQDEKAEAISALERALELAPGTRFIEQLLTQARGG